MQKSKKIAVIGGGAAGLMAAGEAARLGGENAEVTLFEKNEKLAKKVAITGKGRCNVTNLCDVSEFLSNVATNPKFLYSAVNYFSPRDCVDFFENLGVKLKVERGKRVFPVSDSAFDIVDALKKFVKINKVSVRHERVGAIIVGTNCVRPPNPHNICPPNCGRTQFVPTRQTPRNICGRTQFVPTRQIAGLIANGQKYDFDAVIICTGGMSYPATGSTGDGYKLAGDLGHNIIDLKPSLVPLEIREKFCAELMGLSLKNIGLSVYDGAKKIFGDTGEMVFTHFGISGPLVLSASSHIRKTPAAAAAPSLQKRAGEYKITLDLKPGLSEEKLDKRILSDFEKYKNKMFKNSLDDLLPKKLIPVFIRILEDRAGLDPEKKVNGITKSERGELVGLFKNFDMAFKKFRPIEEAIITCGGIDTKEIFSNRMESKLVGGLYFAGEVIDSDAYTGGFNLQIAFSTGKLAGKSALRL
jgi:hypothetical protein